jgi:hypothetical protein
MRLGRRSPAVLARGQAPPVGAWDLGEPLAPLVRGPHKGLDSPPGAAIILGRWSCKLRRQS